MSTNYPAALDSFTNPTSGVHQDVVPHAQQHTDINDAMEAVQAELGTTPSGSRSTVKARLDSMDVDRVLCSAPGVAPVVGWVAGWRVIGAQTLAGFRGDALTAQTSGSVVRWEVKRNGTTVFTTKPTLDNTETTTVAAATPYVFDSGQTAFADNDRVDIYVDQVGDGTARGLQAALQWA